MAAAAVDSDTTFILLCNTGFGKKEEDYRAMYGVFPQIVLCFTNYDPKEIQGDPEAITNQKWFDARKLACTDLAFMAELKEKNLPIFFLVDDVSFDILLESQDGKVVNTKFPGSNIKATIAANVFKDSLRPLADALALVHGMKATHGIFRCSIAIGPIDDEPVVVHGEVKVEITDAVGKGFLDHQLKDSNGVRISTYPQDVRFTDHPRGLAVQETMPQLPL
jgi:hypothetical protein